VRSITRRLDGVNADGRLQPGLPPGRVGADARRRAETGDFPSLRRRRARCTAAPAMIRKVYLGALFAMAGCSGLGTPSSNVVEAQVEYNMVVADDRAKFREQDLKYLGSVGPYAVYRITGSDPRLIGPYVKAPTGYGYAMACGATHYFSAQTTALSPPAALQLRGGLSGNTVLVDVPQMPQDQGGCTTPKDTFGNPVPDGGTGGAGGTGGGGSGGSTGGDPGSGTGGTGCTSPEGGCGTPGGGSGGSGGTGGSSGGGTPGDGTGGDTGGHQIGMTMHPPLPVGSTVLLRRLALTAAQQHNGSHVEPNICCTGDVCALQ